MKRLTAATILVAIIGQHGCATNESGALATVSGSEPAVVVEHREPTLRGTIAGLREQHGAVPGASLLELVGARQAKLLIAQCDLAPSNGSLADAAEAGGPYPCGDYSREELADLWREIYARGLTQ